MPVVHPSQLPPKSQRSTMETQIISIDEVNTWQIPPFQRTLRVTPKVQAIAADIKANGTSINGILTLGRVNGDKATYIVDGQHRCEAFRLSGLTEIIADIRIVHFDSMAEMGEEFVSLNSAIVRMRPDDILRGMTPSSRALSAIVKECPFVGYDHVRLRGGTGPIVSLGQTIRCWTAAAQPTPTSNVGGQSITTMAVNLDMDSAEKLIHFLNLAHTAWGRDPEYFRLWGALNMAMNMWLYRNLVLNKERRGSFARVIVLSESQFKQCLMALSADTHYVDWLQGRLLNDRDRSPCYTRLRSIYVRRLSPDATKKISFPQPAWASK